MQILNEVKLYIKAGNGGKGIISWWKAIIPTQNGPCGGDGGNGGNVIIQGDSSINSLFHLRNRTHVYATNGGNGKTHNKKGAIGADTILKVPFGTKIYDDKRELIIKINELYQEHIICHGGQGGFGNFHLKSKTNKHPIECQPGKPGEEKNIILEVENMADIGLVGLPNAGKSTFIGTISNSKPKVGNYQFTTIKPTVGVVNYKNQRLVFADMPGIIEGASKNRGLGYETLNNIKKCKLLLHMISIDPIDNPNPMNAYQIINNELSKYDIHLPIIVVFTKNDQNLVITNFAKAIKEKIFTISSLKYEGINELLQYIFATTFTRN